VLSTPQTNSDLSRLNFHEKGRALKSQAGSPAQRDHCRLPTRC